MLARFAEGFRVGAEFAAKRGVTRVVEIQKASVTLPTGSVLAGDPYCGLDGDPFSEVLAPGVSPVEFAIAEVPGFGPRLAAARLLASDLTPVRCEEARPSAFGVDNAAACIVDVSVAKAIMDAAMGGDSGHYDWIEKAIVACTGHWLKAAVPDMKDVHLLVFQTGFGDGVYGSYYIRDAGGCLCSITLDFGVIPMPAKPDAHAKPRPWWRLW